MQDKLYILPALQPEQADKSNLPMQITPLIDREQELSAICAILCRPDVRLLTLTGAPGIGKTRLALQVASQLIDDFTDGVFFIPLASISDPALVAPTIAQTFELREAGSQPIPDLLHAYLQHKHLLLLLDNFEQILSAASLLASLLGTCPRLKILITSREVLRLRGEHQYSVPPLEVPDLKHRPNIESLAQNAAVALFLQRAQAVKPNFVLTEANAQAISEICHCLDGLPLAIELAAARIKLLSPQALLARLEHRLQVLTHGHQDLPERQQTLRSMITWSYDLLSAQEQRLFRRLSIFVGGCTIEAVEAVCATLDHSDQAIPVLDQATSLIDKSLLQQSEQEGEEPHLIMLETIREYALEALAISGELEAIRQAHALYYLALVEEAEPLLAGAQQVVWFQRLEREHDNLRAAMQWSIEREERREMALSLGGAMRRFWLHGYLSEGRNFLEQVLFRNERVAAPMHTKALIAAARLAYGQGDYEQGEALAEQSLALCRELEDIPGIAYSLFLLALTARDRGHLPLARSLLEESLALYRRIGDKENVAWDLYELAVVVSIQGEYSRARILSEESLAMHRELGNKSGIAASLYSLSRVLFITQGDVAMAHSLLAESAALFKEVGDKESVAWALSLSGLVALNQGDVAVAHSLLEDSVALFREMGQRWGITESLSFLAKVFTIGGDQVTARVFYEESLALARKIGYQLWIAPCLEGLANVIAAQGQPEWAVRLWGAAEALRENMGAPMPPVDRAGYEQAVASARQQVGEGVFAAAWAEGRTMTPEQALAAQGQITMPVPTSNTQSIPSAKTATYPNELTAREVEVLRLLAQGLTSAQIAVRLVLSLLTVNTHVRSIYSKLGVSSRSAATRWAIEHKLV